MIEFIDSNGNKRTDVDGNNQYLSEGVGAFPPYGESWHLADTWSLDLAAKLIATGWPNVDIEADKVDAKLPIGLKRSDEAKGRLKAYSHFVGLATLAIKDGRLSDNDSPDAWLDWAQSKHYKIVHLTKYLGRSLSDKDAAFFAGIDAMLEPLLKPVDYKQLKPSDTLPAKVNGTTPAPVTQGNKLRRNNLDPAIDKAIKLAGNMKLADVYLQLKELALAGEKPFTGALEGDALCYTNDNNLPDKLTKNALGKKLKRRATPSQ